MRDPESLRVVLDSSVFVSAFLTKEGLAAELLKRCLESREVCVTVSLLNEVRHTLTVRRHLRRRYPYTDTEVEGFLQLIRDSSTPVTPPEDVSIVRDPTDDKILACAVAAGAKVLITRDDDLLVLEEYGEIQILTPETFIHILRAES